MVDNEHKGQNGSIRVDGDELVFSRGGILKRAVMGDDVWHVPVACIREVLFKENRVTGGYMHLVVADAETPKNSSMGVAGHRWTIDFGTGKQAKEFRKFNEWLQGCIHHNRTLGVDPTKARRPYVDTAAAEELDAAKQRMLGDSLVRQPAPEATPAEVIGLARQHPGYAEAWTDLDTLPDRLSPDEPIRLLAAGMLGVSPALIALTDRRVVFHSDNPMSRKADELALADVQVSWNSALIHGGLLFRAPGREVKVSALSDATATAFVQAVGPRPPTVASAPPASTASPDAMEQLRQLADLHTGGVLTDEEFQAKKAELLRRI